MNWNAKKRSNLLSPPNLKVCAPLIQVRESATVWVSRGWLLPLPPICAPVISLGRPALRAGFEGPNRERTEGEVLRMYDGKPSSRIEAFADRVWCARARV